MSAAIVDGCTPCPGIGECAVDEFPTASVGLKVVVPSVANNFGDGGGAEVNNVAPLAFAVNTAADGFHLYGVGGQYVKVGKCVG